MILRIKPGIILTKHNRLITILSKASAWDWLVISPLNVFSVLVVPVSIIAKKSKHGLFHHAVTIKFIWMLMLLIKRARRHIILLLIIFMPTTLIALPGQNQSGKPLEMGIAA